MMIKNLARVVDEIDLGTVGEMTTIGLVEAVQKIPKYISTCYVVSKTAEMIRVRMDIFMKQVASS